jgi:hypothetical protein
VTQVAGEVTAELVRYPDQLAVIRRTGSSASSTGLIEGFLAQTGLTLESQPRREVRMLAFQLL